MNGRRIGPNNSNLHQFYIAYMILLNVNTDNNKLIYKYLSLSSLVISYIISFNAVGPTEYTTTTSTIYLPLLRTVNDGKRFLTFPSPLLSWLKEHDWQKSHCGSPVLAGEFLKFEFCELFIFTFVSWRRQTVVKQHWTQRYPLVHHRDIIEMYVGACLTIPRYHYEKSISININSSISSAQEASNHEGQKTNRTIKNCR